MRYRKIFDQLKEQYMDEVQNRKYMKDGHTYYVPFSIEDIVVLLQTQNMLLGAIADDLAILTEEKK